ncbi:alpha/beta hydrolase [Micrococcus lylae]|uniref:alpha/beta hydrolase n=1 Tax=Micrococcus lylae TaxID=1273 RepID=UPI000C7FC97B|nr:alpha/beta fold hydrolase [Micrococcus lylae]WIK83099.1 alpha/beta fold hydrolase [Micrococcus lylae]
MPPTRRTCPVPPTAAGTAPVDPVHRPLDLPPARGAGDRAVVMVHGFTSGPHSVKDWAHALAERGSRVIVPLLPGHGTCWQDLNRVSAEDLRGAVRAHVDRALAEHRHVVVAGLSMGGALALDAAAHRPVAGVAVVNPALSFGQPLAHAAPLLRWVVASTAPVADDVAAPVSEHAYERTPVGGVAALGRIQRAAVRGLPRITADVVSYWSPQDHVVPPSSQDRLRAGLRAAAFEQVRLERSYHVATMDRDLPLIVEHSAAFVDSVCRKAARR